MWVHVQIITVHKKDRRTQAWKGKTVSCSSTGKSVPLLRQVISQTFINIAFHHGVGRVDKQVKIFAKSKRYFTFYWFHLSKHKEAHHILSLQYLWGKLRRSNSLKYSIFWGHLSTRDHYLWQRGTICGSLALHTSQVSFTRCHYPS